MWFLLQATCKGVMPFYNQTDNNIMTLSLFFRIFFYHPSFAYQRIKIQRSAIKIVTVLSRMVRIWKRGHIIQKLIVSGKEITEVQDIAEELNKYFSNVGQNLVKELFKNNPHQGQLQDLLSICLPSVKNSLFCKPVTQNELVCIDN